MGKRQWRNRKHRVYTKYLQSAYPLIIEHYKTLKEINKKYGTNITMKLSSSFKKSIREWKKERNKHL